MGILCEALTPLEHAKCQVDDLIKQLYVVIVQIENASVVLDKVEDEDLRSSFAEDVVGMVAEYHGVCAVLKYAIEDYQKVEEKLDAPIDLGYHRVYNRLLKAGC